MDDRRLKVLLIAPYFDRQIPGESWSTYKWVEGVSRFCDVTVLTTHPPNWDSGQSPTDAVEVVNWPDLKLPAPLLRLGHQLKPGYVLFYFRARRWINSRLKSGWDFDLIHQINPLALRYPSPAAGLGLTYIIGPLAGSVDTPPGFASEEVDRQWFRKLRHLDKFRIRHDPLLHRTYAEAAIVLGVAPYVRELLAPAGIRHFKLMSETGVEQVSTSPKTPPVPGEPLRLLFVGRIIRTKGILDAIRAVALVSKDYNLQFDVIGDGDLLRACRKEAVLLGVSHIVHFHGRRSREEINQYYALAHVFLFPSFREPSGNVVFEALSHGCPVITADAGGPGYVVDDKCGILVQAENPEKFAEKLAGSIAAFCENIQLVNILSAGALSKISATGRWEYKIRWMVNNYHEIDKQ